jgi:hypothetical protein
MQSELRKQPGDVQIEAELRKQPGDGLYTAHRMARAIPLLTIAELREQPGVLWPEPNTGRLAPHRLHRGIRSLRCVAR